MTSTVLRLALAAGLLVAATGASVARNSDSGSGLSPYAALSGNDRSAGVNNGNYTQPRYNPYLRAYGPRRAPVTYPGRPVPTPYYGYPY
ncbi:hypothetical protein [Methylobacterium oryzihabitans]|uniref:Uncharacterized protein n=1 Tax=Methylobacterium oryzihabitans TaxID=2499852 RepID=A0A3S3UC21_9HYPH|nr:hypothetical protein [Methylobacterium oryzihabitans]RVU20543.1 hypothetical protein EOE48_04115 [Methylobacterium oryzihabitans]